MSFTSARVRPWRADMAFIRSFQEPLPEEATDLNRLLDLVFDEELLSASGTSAPFELRDLQLIDQTRMGMLHRQARAVVID